MALKRTGRNPLAYMGVAPQIAAPLTVNKRRPTTSDVYNWEIGTSWVIPKKLPTAPEADPSEELWILMGNAIDPTLGVQATWVNIASSTGELDVRLVQADSGAPVAPTSDTNTINLVGSTFITTIGTPINNTIQITTSLDDSGLVQIIGNSGGAVMGTGTPKTLTLVGEGSLTVTGDPMTNTLTIADSSSGSINELNRIQLTGSGTYTAPTNLVFAMVTVQGSGGGAGNSQGGSVVVGAGGGGSGAYCQRLFTASDLSSPQGYVVGLGGLGGATGITGINGQDGTDSSFGILTAGAGKGSLFQHVSSGGTIPFGGDGGSASGDSATTLINGQQGSMGTGIPLSSMAGSGATGGSGASSTMGQGGVALNALYSGGTLPNQNGVGFGAGGAGAAFPTSASNYQGGGNGTDGTIIILEYLS